MVVPCGEGVIGKEAGAASVTGPGVDHDEIGGVGIDFPFPPIGADASGAVRAVEGLEHEALDAAGAGLVPEWKEVVPCGKRCGWGELNGGVVALLEEADQFPAAGLEGLVAQIGVPGFQAIEGEESGWGFAEEFGRGVLAADALLEPVEFEGAILLPAEQFPIEDGTVGEVLGGGGDFGKGIGDIFVAA